MDRALLRKMERICIEAQNWIETQTPELNVKSLTLHYNPHHKLSVKANFHSYQFTQLSETLRD